MAQITWQNVNAPTNADVFKGMALAAANFNDGASSLSKLGDHLQTVNQDILDRADASKALQAKAALVSAQNPAEYRRALASTIALGSQMNDANKASTLVQNAAPINQSAIEAQNLAQGASQTMEINGITHPIKVNDAEDKVAVEEAVAPIRRKTEVGNGVLTAKLANSGMLTKQELFPTAEAAQNLSLGNIASGALIDESKNASLLPQQKQHDWMSAFNGYTPIMATDQAILKHAPIVEQVAKDRVDNMVQKDKQGVQVGAVPLSDDEISKDVSAARGSQELQRQLATYRATEEKNKAEYGAAESSGLIQKADIETNNGFNLQLKNLDTEKSTLQSSRYSPETLQTFVSKIPNTGQAEQLSVTEGVSDAIQALRSKYGNIVDTLPQRVIEDSVNSHIDNAATIGIKESVTTKVLGDLEKHLLSEDGKKETEEYRTKEARLDLEYKNAYNAQMVHQRDSLGYAKTNQRAVKIKEEALKADSVKKQEAVDAQDKVNKKYVDNLKKSINEHNYEPLLIRQEQSVDKQIAIEKQIIETIKAAQRKK